jgi:3-polyprenyl-4-hydroxybenzoate decarboxylase
MKYSDLRDFISQLERIGELRRNWATVCCVPAARRC